MNMHYPTSVGNMYQNILSLVIFYTHIVTTIQKTVTESSLSTVNADSETATFALGCFWAPESVFGSIPGVITTKVGYTGGSKGCIPTYKNMSDYTEAVQMQFDPYTVSYLKLLDVFWENHDPTIIFSKQYSSIIYFHNDEQLTFAKMSLKEKKSKGLNIVTKIEPAGEFFNAEDKHQKHRLRKHPILCKELGFQTAQDFIDSHVAARLNGYVVGHGGIQQFDEELPKLKLNKICVKYIRNLLYEYKRQGMYSSE